LRAEGLVVPTEGTRSLGHNLQYVYSRIGSGVGAGVACSSGVVAGAGGGSAVGGDAGSGSAVGSDAGSGSTVGGDTDSGSAVGGNAGSSSAVIGDAGSGSAVGGIAGSGDIVSVSAGSGSVVSAGGGSAGWIGIGNNSVFCYSNSILQCLAHVYLICPQEYKYLKPSLNSLYNGLMSIVRDLSEKKVIMENVGKFRSSVLSYLPLSEHNRMQDVREILLLLFENTHVEEVTFMSCFSTLRSTVLICPTCATIHEGFADIVQVIDVNSLDIQSQLDHMLMGEVPRGYKCESCGKVDEVIKRSVITSLPFCLCFSINTRILQEKVPATIILREYSDCIYNLVSISLHQSHSRVVKAESKTGHYISIFHDNPLFCLANESSIRSLNDKELDEYLCPKSVDDFKPYLVFYCIDLSCINQLISVRYSGELSNIVHALYLIGDVHNEGLFFFF
jgi:hypothetical protein